MTGLPAKSVRRREDVRLLTGGGNYASDGKAAGMTAAVLVRSPHAHANIARLDTAAAKAMPGEQARLSALGAAAVFTKPFDPLKLGDEVRRVVSRLGGHTGSVA